MSVGRPLPPGVPVGLANRMAGRMIGPGAPAAPPTLPAGAPAEGMGQIQPAPPPQAPPQGGPPQGAPPGGPEGDGQDQEEGLSPQIAETLRDLMKKKKSRGEIESIVRQVSKDSRNSSALKIDPAMRLKLAQGWNARLSESGKLLIQSRGQSPGASKVSDEALLRMYWTTPQGVELEDIDTYADAVRRHLIMEQGIRDDDEVEDTTMRWCFPLRELTITAGRKGRWREMIDFVQQIMELTEKWLKEYGKLPEPDWKTMKATEAGKGDPESKAIDTDSSAYPTPGPQRDSAIRV